MEFTERAVEFAPGNKLAPVLQANNAGFRELLERAQEQLQHLDSSISSDQATSTQDKLLQRCLRTQIEPVKDLILLRKISDGQSGSVYLIRTRLSSLESLNQSNLYILKKVSKRISRKIQQYSSIETEQKILEQSRTGTGINKVKRTPLLHLSFQTGEELNIVIEYSPSGSITEHLSREALKLLSKLNATTCSVSSDCNDPSHRLYFMFLLASATNRFKNHPASPSVPVAIPEALGTISTAPQTVGKGFTIVNNIVQYGARKQVANPLPHHRLPFVFHRLFVANLEDGVQTHTPSYGSAILPGRAR
ncbi:hypothetical protein H4Q26_003761 [Puccinia striiformis f. sp. tritici PST-130]|nr:hypothetical protein H4Q26_003761 [Puccinia striiformis f. sp. tritici PST-130]